MRSGLRRKGYAIVGLMIVALIILSAILAVQTTAVVTVGNTSAAFDNAKQNATFLLRLERATREAAQSSLGVNLARAPETFAGRIDEILAAAPLGAVELKRDPLSEISNLPRAFPNWSGSVSPLVEPSQALRLMTTPRLEQFLGGHVAESQPWTVGFGFTRQNGDRELTFRAEVDCRIVYVPLTRFAVSAYDLPSEIGEGSDRAIWPDRISPDSFAPRGLVSSRDPAALVDAANGESRTSEFRPAASVAEAYQFLFSGKYLQGVADYAGVTHFVQIGGASANPTLHGGSESAHSYSLDLAQFGEGKYAAEIATKDAVVIVGASGGSSVLLSDSAGLSGPPALVVLVGPARDTEVPMQVTISGEIRRPVVIVCYHCRIEGIDSPVINGALFCDPECSVFSTTETIVVGHLSCWGGSAGIIDHFSFAPMPDSAEGIAPRVAHVITASRLL